MKPGLQQSPAEAFRFALKVEQIPASDTARRMGINRTAWYRQASAAWEFIAFMAVANPFAAISFAMSAYKWGLKLAKTERAKDKLDAVDWPDP